jgi:hypothetical protein
MDIQSITQADWEKLTDVIYGKRDPGQHGTEPPAICGTWYEWPFQVAYNVSRNKVNDTGADTTGGFIPLENAYAKMLAINNQNTHVYLGY